MSQTVPSQAAPSQSTSFPEVTVALQTYLKRLESSNLSPNQRFVAALFWHTCDRLFKMGRRKNAPILVGVAVMVLGSFLAINLLYAITHALGGDKLLPAFTAVIGLLPLFVSQKHLLTVDVGLYWISKGKDKTRKIDRLSLGELGELIHNGLYIGVLFLFGQLMVAQTALIYHTGSHLGIEEVRGLGDSIVITLKSAFYIPLDLIELYIGKVGGIRLEQLPPYPATVINICKVTYAGLMGVLLFNMFQRWRFRRLAKSYPHTEDLNEFLNWNEQIGRDPANFGRKLHNEMVFCAIAEEYIRGNFTLVREMSRQFVSVGVKNSVRKLFVHPETGELLFELREETSKEKQKRR